MELNSPHSAISVRISANKNIGINTLTRSILQEAELRKPITIRQTTRPVAKAATVAELDVDDVAAVAAMEAKLVKTRVSNNGKTTSSPITTEDGANGAKNITMVNATFPTPSAITAAKPVTPGVTAT